MEQFITDDIRVDEALLACFVAAGSGTRLHKDRQSHGLAMYASGQAKYVFDDGKELIAKKNQIIYLPKHSFYEVVPIEEGDCYAVNFTVMPDRQCDAEVFRPKNPAPLLDAFAKAKTAWTAKTEGYLLKVKSLLYDILYALLREKRLSYISRQKADVITPAVRLIHENYASENLTIARLSRMCGITPEYFRRIFASVYGISPKRYIENLKLTRAKELLQSGMYSVTEAATLSGYTDMSHFSRCFKKYTGVAPKNF